MSKTEIIERVIREMTENALALRRDNLLEAEQRLYTEASQLRKSVDDIMKNHSSDEQQILEEFIVKSGLIADHECAFLYVQGATDCVELLKKLGVFG